MRRLSFLVKVKWIILTSFFKLSNTNTDYFLKVMGYWIQGTYARFVHKFSFFIFSPFLLIFLVPRAFFLAAVTGLEIIRTNTSFWILFFKIFGDIITFLLAVEEFDLRDIFFFLFRKDIDTCGRVVMPTTMFLSSTPAETSLIVLVFLTGLVLVDGLFPT